MRLDLGGGTKNTAAPGHINIDLTEDADIQWDLNLGLPNNNIPKSKFQTPVEGIRCHQVVRTFNYKSFL
jgi:hypothetical protein